MVDSGRIGACVGGGSGGGVWGDDGVFRRKDLLKLPQAHGNVHRGSLLNPLDRRLSINRTQSTTDREILNQHIMEQDRP